MPFDQMVLHWLGNSACVGCTQMLENEFIYLSFWVYQLLMGSNTYKQRYPRTQVFKQFKFGPVYAVAVIVHFNSVVQRFLVALAGFLLCPSPGRSSSAPQGWRSCGGQGCTRQRAGAASSSFQGLGMACPQQAQSPGQASSNLKHQEEQLETKNYTTPVTLSCLSKQAEQVV